VQIQLDENNDKDYFLLMFAVRDLFWKLVFGRKLYFFWNSIIFSNFLNELSQLFLGILKKVKN
jgi:hypothetical protein